MGVRRGVSGHTSSFSYKFRAQTSTCISTRAQLGITSLFQAQLSPINPCPAAGTANYILTLNRRIALGHQTSFLRKHQYKFFPWPCNPSRPLTRINVNHCDPTISRRNTNQTKNWSGAPNKFSSQQIMCKCPCKKFNVSLWNTVRNTEQTKKLLYGSEGAVCWG